MAQFSITEAKTNLSRLIADALAGSEVLIVRDGLPVVRLVPIKPAGHRQFGALKGRIAIEAGIDAELPANELALWYIEQDGSPILMR